MPSLGFDNEQFYHQFNKWGREQAYSHIPQPNIYYDDKEFERLAKCCQNAPELFEKAVRSALRRVGRYMRKAVRQGIKSVSYFDNRDIRYAISQLQYYGAQVSLTVLGAQAAAHKFKLVPNRITARKGMRSVNWPSPGVRPGPYDSVRHPRKKGYYKPFIAEINGLKAMYWREKSTGDLSMPTVASPQYFAAYDRVQKPILSTCGEIFLQRLAHEIDYRLKLS